MSKHRQPENVRSGDQIVDGGRWDRVHGNSGKDSDGAVTIRSDSGERTYPAGSTVEIV